MNVIDLKSGDNAIDATIGGGGHALAILEATKPAGQVLALDTDEQSLKIASINLKPYRGRVIFENANFNDLEAVVKKQQKFSARLVLADLGPAMWHLTESEYGGSFSAEGILDMRRGDDSLSASDVIRGSSRDKLAKIFSQLGEEKMATEIANYIYLERKKVKQFSTTWLAGLVASVYKKHRVRSSAHPATKVFQALRMYVNKELENLASFLPQALSVAARNGKIAIITFHSIEDRLVKNYFRQLASERAVKILTKHALQASRYEQRQNPASRSAKLRVVQKIVNSFSWPTPVPATQI